MEACLSLEVAMLEHRKFPLIAAIGLVPVVLAACGNASSSNDPRTRAPLVRVSAVATAAQSQRSFTGIVAAWV